MSQQSDDCGCYACRCGHPHLCRYEPIPVVYTDLDRQPSTLGIIARHEARFYYEKKGEEA